MRIYNVSNTTFGYNKELNEKINQKLAKQRGIPEVDQHLLRLNKFCMSTEDRLRAAEKDGESDLVNFYSNLLITLKSPLAEELNERYPNMNYRKNEIKAYNKEINHRNLKDVNHWLLSLVDTLETDEAIISENGALATSNRSSNLPSLFAPVIEEKINSTSGETQNSKVLSLDNKQAQASNFLEFFDPSKSELIGFDSLGGMEDLKEMFEEEIIEPILYPDMAQADELEYGKKMPNGVMLYGPPGCGKTSIIEALSTESKLPLFKLKIAKAGSKYINETAANTQAAFEYLAKYASDNNKPVLLFMDEVESMTPNRNGKHLSKEDLKLVSTLLPLISDARNNNIIIIGATNCYDMVDDAISNRFEIKKYIGLPNKETRIKVLSVLLNKISKGKALASNIEELSQVANITEGFSNRSLTFLTQKAARLARNDGRRDITVNDFKVVVSENQNMKIKEDRFKPISERKTVGFGEK